MVDCEMGATKISIGVLIWEFVVRAKSDIISLSSKTMKVIMRSMLNYFCQNMY